MKRSWFRVTVDSGGKTIDCRPVSTDGDNALRVFYVLATSAKEAARLAGNEHARVLLAARRTKYRSEGLCKCGSAILDKAFTHCERCRERAKVHHRRTVAKARGEVLQPLDRREVLKEKRVASSEAVRLETLLEVQAAWRNHSTVGGFRQWLDQELAKLAGRKVA